MKVKRFEVLLKALAATAVFIKTYYCSHDRSQFQHPFLLQGYRPFSGTQHPRQSWA